MRYRNRRTTQEEQRRFDEMMAAFYHDLLNEIPIILKQIPDKNLQQKVYALAFRANKTLPKRQSRPQIIAAFLVDQLFHVFSDGNMNHQTRSSLLRFTVIVQEYYDILDDIVDGDVDQEHLPLVLLVNQTLLPLLLNELSKLGSRATEYWSERALSLVSSVFVEKCKEKNKSNFILSLDAQSWLYGFCTGLPAVISEQKSLLCAAENIGRSAYRYSKLTLDLDQVEDDGDDQWNARHFFSKAEIHELLQKEHQCLCEHIALLPPGQYSENIRSLFSVELE